MFRTADPRRDNFLARLLGLFSEEAVRFWAATPEAPYEDLGRPWVVDRATGKGHTLDFTFRHKESGRVFVGEMKCELAWEGYRYLQLTDAGQIEHHRGSAAFSKLLTVAKDPKHHEVRVGGRVILPQGAILVWGATTPGGVESAKAAYGFEDVLALDRMLEELQVSTSGSWKARIQELSSWSAQLFDFLGSSRLPT